MRTIREVILIDPDDNAIVAWNSNPHEHKAHCALNGILRSL